MGHLFLSYAREDYSRVSEIYTAMREAGLSPWMDEPPAPWLTDGIPPGAVWEAYIKEKIERADLVLCFLSLTSVSKTGYVQKELRSALACLSLRPAGQSFVLPVRLDPCEIPPIEVDTIRLRAVQRFDFFRYGIDVLLKWLGVREPDEPKIDLSLLRAILAEERGRMEARLEAKERRIAELEKDLKSTQRQVPPVEIYHDPSALKWWLQHGHKREDEE